MIGTLALLTSLLYIFNRGFIFVFQGDKTKINADNFPVQTYRGKLETNICYGGNTSFETYAFYATGETRRMVMN